MASQPIVLLLLFLIGLAQGMTLCTITCGPLVLLRIAGQEKGPREGFLSAFYFSLPRIIVFTLIGAVMGVLGFGLADALNLASLSWFPQLVYLFLSLVMIATGLFFLGIIKRSGSMGRGIRYRLMSFLLKLTPKKGRSERRAMFGLGLMMSVLCLGEAQAIMLFWGANLGISSSDWLSGAFYGMVGMMLFSTGMVVPMILLGTAAGSLSRRMNGDDLRKVGGLLLIIIGVFLLIYEHSFRFSL